MSDLAGMAPETARAIHRTMVAVRMFETRVSELFLAGKLPGFVHTYIGQEAIAAGVCAALRPDDYITSTHRGHGHAIAKGMGLDPLMAELYGKATGACGGYGGSMHVADFSLGMLGANGIVGGGFGIAAGAAFSARYRGSGQVAVCFFGDGGINKGTFHEAMNFAAVHQLPVVFVCENNQYAQFTSAGRTTSVDDVAIRATGYGMAGETIDGNDAAATYQAAAAAVGRARDGAGPALLNMITYRHGGHYVGDAEVYRDRDEVDEWKGRDPIPRFESKLVAAGIATAEDLERVSAQVSTAVAAAEAFAEDSEWPDPGAVMANVFTEPA